MRLLSASWRLRFLRRMPVRRRFLGRCSGMRGSGTLDSGLRCGRYRVHAVRRTGVTSAIVVHVALTQRHLVHRRVELLDLLLQRLLFICQDLHLLQHLQQ